MSEFNLSRNSIKKVWCIRGKVDVISAPARLQPKRGRRVCNMLQSMGECLCWWQSRRMR
ncbi:hypothetical protein JG688_00018195 [Phytophthora aleatoria]|uniref:Uncharacterized protein n=1 Tax=Phytophthora aleatoria TaxID=2496075 RepID=A0A8J5I971_9STRA|nr:hypothetical protein JG688_00018195 [Phytophthora aleatoria]